MMASPDPWDLSNPAWAGPQHPDNAFSDADVGYPLCSKWLADDPGRLILYDGNSEDAWIECDGQTDAVGRHDHC